MTAAIKRRFNELPVEEVANTVTHGFGLILSVVGFIALIFLAVEQGGKMLFAASLVYGISLIVLYTASTVYHVTTSAELKKVLRIVDHCCIYLLIAGSYTPFGLVILNGLLGQSLLAAVWLFAVVGITAKLIFRERFPVLSVLSYLVMGWLGVVALQPILEAIGFTPVLLAVLGGLSYSLGVVFFGLHRIPHNHAIFHVFVLGGSILHFAAVAVYVVPYAANL
jgi:hemolysin III